MGAEEILEGVNRVLGGVILPLLLLGAGGYFSWRLHFSKRLRPTCAFRELLGGTGGASSLRALFMALAGTLGVGNITGVALAIRMGGAGSVFWMWVSGLCAMALKYSEITLAMGHRKRVGDEVEGGAVVYVQDVLEELGKKRRPGEGAAAFGKRKRKWALRARVLAGAFAGLCLAAAIFMGGMLQANAAAEVLGAFYQLPTAITGILLAAITAFVIFGGGKKIASLTARMIPLLTILYILTALAVIIPQAPALPRVVARIFKEAFSLSALAGGGAGSALSLGLRHGVLRGLLSNEAGCGTAPMAHVTADNTPARQGLYGVLEVFIDTILLCTLTALAVLLAFETPPALGGAALAVLAFQKGVGAFALPFLTLSVVVFAWGTVLCWAYYGEKSLGHFTRRKGAVWFWRWGFCGLVLLGAMFSSELVLGLTDLSLSLLACINVPVLLLARREIAAYTGELEKNAGKGKALR